MVAIGAAGEQPDMGVGGFRQSVAQAVVEGIIRGRNRLIVRASFTNSGIRQRLAQASQLTNQQRSPGGSFRGTIGMRQIY